ncbi:MAG: ATP-dependent endonuclease [Planctomycetia bacterium]|nr:ATP-dependent endonuclease [Planctomycetia bacterium]
MKMTHLKICNFKGLREVEIPLSPCVCLVGENNAGKSSVLQALALFFSGSPLPRANFFDPAKEVRIEVAFEDVRMEDLARLVDEHRTKIEPIVKSNRLRLVRLYSQDGKSSLKYRNRLPKQDRFDPARLAEFLKGKRAGKAFCESVEARFPELTGLVTAAMTQEEMKGKIQELADRLPDEEKADVDSDLPSGFDKSIAPLLPDHIYIPAVKDLRDEVKTSEGTSFGKILKILLEAIEPALESEKALFDKLNAKLNRVILDDGREADERLTPVKTIEATVERFVQESFSAVKLRIAIPPPDLKTVLSSALIYANDGVDGLIDTKGDGLKRAVIFAILRSYVELNKSGLLQEEPSTGSREPRYVLLFEEPELYLHPRAQQILFTALGLFSKKHPVIVTTHSPFFLGPQTTTTFTKMRKKTDLTVAPRPFGEVFPVDLQGVDARDQFQLICFENNNIAFFADTVVLVEGDSDSIVFPHLARLLNPLWDCGREPIQFARIGGKSNIRRYREFFGRFRNRTFVVTDLDFLLGGEFAQVDPPAKTKKLRDALLQRADEVIEAAGTMTEVPAAQAQRAVAKRDVLASWKRAKALRAEFEAKRASWEDLCAGIEEFFAWEKTNARRDTLMSSTDKELMALKRELITNLRSQGVCVLEKGALEDYYPYSIDGESKTARAQIFCERIRTRTEALALSNDGHETPGGEPCTEFEAIFQTLFSR